MNFCKALWCRTFQTVMGGLASLMPWRKSKAVDGDGCIRELPRLLETCQIKRPIVVTDPGLMSAGVAGRVLETLDGAGVSYALFSDVMANPSVEVVESICALYIESGCDGIIAVGGGSPMDAAKAAGARIARPRKSLAQLAGMLKVGRKIPPFIAIPTTAGTGSETTIAALVTDTASKHKFAIMDLHLVPLYAVLDPCLTTGLPAGVTAATGMDALTHAVEAYLCRHMYTEETRRCACLAVGDIFKYLERAYSVPDDLAARRALLIASYRAGWAFTRSGVGNVHAIAHTLGGLYNTPHGLANAVILPVVLRDYGEKAHAPLAMLSLCAGVGSEDADDAANAEAFIAAIESMNARMGIPTGFDCINPDDIPRMAAWADAEANPLYAVPVLYDQKHFEQVIGGLRLPNADTKAP